MTKARFIRPDDTLDDVDTVVVRGGELDVEIVRADAARYQAIYGVPDHRGVVRPSSCSS